MFNQLSSGILALMMALLSGVLMAVQGSVNSALGKVVGTLETTLVVHGVGTIIAFVLLYILKLGQSGMLYAPGAPWYGYLGGVIGVAISYLVVASIPKVGVANATTAIIVGQVSTAVLIDHLGLFGLERIPCSWMQLLGLVLLAVGAKLLLK